MARKKNPDNKTILLVLAVLTLGGYIVYDEVKKRKKPKALKAAEEEIVVEPELEGAVEPVFSIGPDCTRNTIPYTQENRAIAQGVIDEAIDALGGYDALPDSPEVLQPFLQAWATQIFIRTTHPDCFDVEPPQGDFGSDYTDIALEMPEAAMLYYRMLLFSLMFRFQAVLGEQIDEAPLTENVILNQTPIDLSTLQEVMFSP